MNLEHVDFKELMKKNFFYESVNNISDQIIAKLASPNNWEKNSADFHPDKYLAVGLNKIINDYWLLNYSSIKKHREEGYALIKSYLDISFKTRRIHIEDYKPDKLLFDTFERIFSIGKLVDNNMSNYIKENITRYVSSDIIHSIYIYRLSREQLKFSPEDMSMLEFIRSDARVKKRYHTGKNQILYNPLIFFNNLVMKNDASTLKLIIKYYNGKYAQRDEEKKSSVPVYETEIKLFDLAREADFGIHLKNIDKKNKFPSGLVEKRLNDFIDLTIYGGLNVKGEIKKAAEIMKENLNSN